MKNPVKPYISVANSFPNTLLNKGVIVVKVPLKQQPTNKFSKTKIKGYSANKYIVLDNIN